MQILLLLHWFVLLLRMPKRSSCQLHSTTHDWERPFRLSHCCTIKTLALSLIPPSKRRARAEEHPGHQAGIVNT